MQLCSLPLVWFWNGTYAYAVECSGPAGCLYLISSLALGVICASVHSFHEHLLITFPQPFCSRCFFRWTLKPSTHWKGALNNAVCLCVLFFFNCILFFFLAECAPFRMIHSLTPGKVTFSFLNGSSMKLSSHACGYLHISSAPCASTLLLPPKSLSLPTGLGVFLTFLVPRDRASNLWATALAFIGLVHTPRMLSP